MGYFLLLWQNILRAHDLCGRRIRRFCRYPLLQLYFGLWYCLRLVHCQRQLQMIALGEALGLLRSGGDGAMVNRLRQQQHGLERVANRSLK